MRLTHVEQYYALQMARYSEARAEDMRRRQVELDRSTAWAIPRNEAAARGLLNLPYSPISPEVRGCICMVSSDDSLLTVILNKYVTAE